MRRMVVVGLVGGAAVTAAVVVLARRPPASTLTGEPDWAPLTLTGPGNGPATGTGTAPVDAGPAPVFAAVGEPSAITAVSATAAWVEPDANGACPDSHPVKGKRTSRIYHVPGGHFYDRTRAERCYCDAAAAEADGFRAAKR